MDVLLIQPSSRWKGQKFFSTISNGLFAIAMFLRQRGLDVKICHFVGNTPIEESICSYIRKYNPKVVGINLSWHVHCAEVLRIAEIVKKCSNNIRVVVGGMTASQFYKEILEYLKLRSKQNAEPLIDLMVRGDGEKPLAEYVKSGKPPSYNVSYIDKKGNVIHKPISYIQQDLPRTKLKDPSEIVDNWEGYLNQNGTRTSVPGLESYVGHHRGKSEIDLYIGKGCINNCSYCGGCALTHRSFFSRTGVLFRRVDDVVSDIHSLEQAGVKTVYANFDPDPRRIFYRNLFERLFVTGQKELNLIFSCWSGPVPNELVDMIEYVFKSVEFVISPDSGSESLRAKFVSTGYGRKPFYSNSELMKFFGVLCERGMKAMCYFTAGLPWETSEDWMQTIYFAQQLKERFENVFIKPYDDRLERNLTCVPLYIEPGSPIVRQPEQFGMVISRKSFWDFLANSNSPEKSGFLGGHNIRFSDESEVCEKCVEFNNAMCNVGEFV